MQAQRLRIGSCDELDDKGSLRLSAESFAKETDLDKIISGCARATFGKRTTSIGWYDLKQEGYLAAYAALRQGRVPAEPGHQTSYIARRVLGAMIDAIRASYKHDVNLSDSANYEQVDLGPQPDRAYQIKQAMQALFAKNPRAGHVVVQLVSGYACQDVAKEFSVSGATISHLRAHARNITERFL